MPVGSVASSASFKMTTPSDLEIRLTRLFDAPPELIFEAMHTPEHVKNWWGCLASGYSVPVCDIDLRVGGAWRFVSRTPNGKLVAFHGIYREEYPDVESVVTSELTEENGKTRLTVTSWYPSLEVRNIVLKSGMDRGAAISYDRLEDVVAGLQA